MADSLVKISLRLFSWESFGLLDSGINAIPSSVITGKPIKTSIKPSASKKSKSFWVALFKTTRFNPLLTSTLSTFNGLGSIERTNLRPERLELSPETETRLRGVNLMSITPTVAVILNSPLSGSFSILITPLTPSFDLLITKSNSI